MARRRRSPHRTGVRFWFAVARLVLGRPRLWWTAARQWRRSVPGRWWSRPPFVPLPDAGYLEFRFATAYGDGAPDPLDVVRWLEWCRERARGQDRRAA